VKDLLQHWEILHFVQDDSLAQDNDGRCKTLLVMKKFTYKNFLIFLLLASIFALLFAYISQYIFGLEPCILCLHQRKPFFAVIILTLLALTIPRLKTRQKLFAQVAVLLILINSFIALYHSGVEKKFFQGPAICSADNKVPDNIEELKQVLSSIKVTRCDQPQFVFMNLSMAAWNVVYCLFLVIASLIFLRKIKSS
jgi:disulfide bond formation protein DsbB